MVLTVVTTSMQAQKTSDTFAKKDNVIGIGFGLGGVYGFSTYDAQTPVFGAQYDRGIVEFGMGGILGVGGFIDASDDYHKRVFDIVKDHGGIRGFMKWDHALLTDSGGYQVFSLSDMRKITEEGVTFRHHKSGEKLFMSPEDSIRIQNNLGADIIMSFDECPPFDSTYEYMKNSVERTLRWAQRGQKEHKRPADQALFGIVQGGPYEDLRKMCAEELIKMEANGRIKGLSH